MTKKEALFKDLEQARDEVNRLLVKYHELKNSQEYADLISAAASSDDMESAMKAVQDWDEANQFTATHDALAAAQERLTKANHAFDDYREQQDIKAEQQKIRKSGLPEPEFRIKQAIRVYGYTYDFQEAGYLLPNGGLLNFTGEKGKHHGNRGTDHRNIGFIYASSAMTGFTAMEAFMRCGNIRVMAELPGIDISIHTIPTKEQYSVIRSMATALSRKRFFSVDFTDENGHPVTHLEYDGYFSPSRIVDDIKAFYEK